MEIFLVDWGHKSDKGYKFNWSTRAVRKKIKQNLKEINWFANVCIVLTVFVQT